MSSPNPLFDKKPIYDDDWIYDNEKCKVCKLAFSEHNSNQALKCAFAIVKGGSS
jgi:hypothetical protein